jgi:hypothetical protein
MNKGKNVFVSYSRHAFTRAIRVLSLFGCGFAAPGFLQSIFFLLNQKPFKAISSFITEYAPVFNRR